jgi:starch-binding outer membrane protein, SusD/RagB family
MKKIIYIPIVIILILSACDVLDVQPYHSMPADEAITDSAQVQSAIIGCFDALQSGSYYGLDFLIWGDLPADNLKHVGITVTWSDIDNNNILADNGLVEGTWVAIYRVLSRVNNTMAQIPNIDNEKLSQEGKNTAMAELRFLRALAHYDLMRLFGPIPIRDRAVTNDEESLNPARNSISEILQIVNDDLEFAMQYLPANPIRGRASRPAAIALKARVSLHQYFITENTNFLNLAKALATEVIDHPALELETNYASLYTQEPTSESVFEVSFNEQDRNLIARYFAHTSLAGRYEFAPTDFYLNSFDPNDVRKDISTDMAGTDPYVVKFNDVASGTDPVYVLRLAEMYLIRAEAATILQDDTDEILSDINQIRVRAGLTPATMTSYTALAIEIESQRQKEFAFEGHRWFDLVRTGRAIDRLENVTSINQTLFPIPQAEIISNDNPGMYQNEGY